LLDLVPQVVGSSAPSNLVSSIVSDTELGISWSAPLFDGSDAVSVTKYKIQWDLLYGFPNTDASTTEAGNSHIIESALCAAGDLPYCTFDTVNNVYRYKIHGLATSTLYHLRVAAYTSVFGWSGRAEKPVAPTQTTALQAPHKPSVVTMDVSQINVENQLEVYIELPIWNPLQFRSPNGGAPVTFYRIEYDTNYMFPGGAGSGSYDWPT
jgi:hypothetical protein